MSIEKNKNLLPRPPIVVILGHVDHGKTTLLDYIRRTNVVAKEAGGITQATGAYEIIHSSKEAGESRKITFIDTPGHEAFSKMRERGANVADLGILVIAADEGVKPQTKEAIKILQESKIPFIVAINKIDRTNADIERVKKELMEVGVLLEGFGGNISWQGISAKTGEGINELLDLIILAAELEDLSYNSEKQGSGVIIESQMDSRRGLSVSAVIKDGALKVGDEIATASAVGKIKILEDFLGKRVKKLYPSSPALILGFETLPQTGEEFFSGKVDLAEIKKNIFEADAVKEESTKNTVNFILKADVSGSLEVLAEIIKNISDTKIINKSVGDINDGDIKSAFSSNAAIIGFKVKTSKAAENLAKNQGVKIIISEIIYELIKEVEKEIKNMKDPEIAGELEILAVFNGKKSKRQVIGGKVILGDFKSNSIVKIQRDGKEIGQGKVVNLQCDKEDTGQVKEGKECGILLDSDVPMKAGDKLIYW
ncbi:GTP-binding protein [Candidatus Wolfebacteria bacterium]|nr:GTP-binding protein [Candidatus Wolfebacteria bacterium]